MLKRLSINNFAIIKELHFTPQLGFNIITGETGAGKSIIMDALGLILGERADIKAQSDNAMQNTSQKCVIEGEFDISNLNMQSLFEELELDYDSLTIIRREIAFNGKSRSFVNDTPVSLIDLKKISEQLILIHSQHENTHLSEKLFQFNFIDSFAQNNEVLNQYQSAFQNYKSNINALNQLLAQQKELNKEKDYLEFLLKEFEALKLQDNEEQSLEQELQLLSHAEQIIQTAEMSVQSLNSDEQSVISVLNVLKNKFKSIMSYSKDAQQLFERLDSVSIELKDIASESEHLIDTINMDEKRLEEVNDRMNSIYLLKKKHGVTDFNELLDVFKTIDDKLAQIGTIDQGIEQMNLKNLEIQKTLEIKANFLHQNREKASKKLKTELEKLLSDLDMPKAVVEFEMNQKTDFDELGNTELNMKFSANAGISPQLLGKVASGGELSRLALSIRTIEAQSNRLGTLIFDEIDTGVSGKVAANIGKMFKVISKQHQTIAITHLPQVAACGNQHYFVSKKEINGSTETHLKTLNNEERINEIANMLSGDSTSEIAKQNAKELLQNASN